jgi:hypothetical protein
MTNGMTTVIPFGLEDCRLIIWETRLELGTVLRGVDITVSEDTKCLSSKFATEAVDREITYHIASSVENL